jgi:hypothetical protein
LSKSRSELIPKCRLTFNAVRDLPFAVSDERRIITVLFNESLSLPNGRSNALKPSPQDTIRMASQSTLYDILKVAALWIMLLILPFTERTLLGIQTYYGLFIGLGLVFVIYGLTIYSIFAFLQHTKRHPVYIWIAFLLWSLFICCILAVFAIEYDLLPHTSDPSLAGRRPLIDYLYFEIMTFTTVGYGDIVPLSAHGKLLAICTALLGATHGVTFMALTLHALTQQPPAKSQE